MSTPSFHHTPPLFNRICIIGYGLIGSSLARAILKHRLTETLVCADPNLSVCQRVEALDIAHEITSDVTLGVRDADLVIMAVPVGACGPVMAQIGPYLADGAIVTDVGSVKQSVVDAVMPHLPPYAHFIPAHPIAGTENSGPDAGFAELFEKRWCILTPLPNSEIKAVEKVTALWNACGSQIEIMEPSHHDLVLAITSHLPHLIAYTIVDTAVGLERYTQAEVIKYSASGFRDFTRIAASNPVMWRDIFLNNRDAVLNILQRFNEDLTALQKAIRMGDGALLEETFTRTRSIRREVIQAGQAGPHTATPAAAEPESATGPKVSGGSVA